MDDSAPRTTTTVLALLSEHADLISVVASFLTLSDIEALTRVNRALHDVASTSHEIWDGLCCRIWEDKDATRRALGEEELTSFEWNFRFKEAAGEGWTEADPYWNDKPPTRVRFDVHGGMHPSGFEVLEGRQLAWQWGKHGDHTKLRLSVDGRQVPSYIISRHAANWGWVMQSCWVVYTSFPMPARGTDEALDDAALGVSVDDQRHEARMYNTGMALASDDDDDDDQEEGDGSANLISLETANGHVTQIPAWLLQQLMVSHQANQDGSDGDGDSDDGREDEVDNDDEEEAEEEDAGDQDGHG